MNESLDGSSGGLNNPSPPIHSANFTLLTLTSMAHTFLTDQQKRSHVECVMVHAFTEILSLFLSYIVTLYLTTRPLPSPIHLHLPALHKSVHDLQSRPRLKPQHPKRKSYRSISAWPYRIPRSCKLEKVFCLVVSAVC